MPTYKHEKRELLWVVGFALLSLLGYGMVTQWQYPWVACLGPDQAPVMWSAPMFVGWCMVILYIVRSAVMGIRGKFASPITMMLLAISMLGVGVFLWNLWEMIWNFRRALVLNTKPNVQEINIAIGVLGACSLGWLWLFLRVAKKGWKLYYRK